MRAWSEYFKRRRERAEAERRARRTLLSRLTPDQRLQLDENFSFDIVAASGTRYRIRPGNTVQRLDPSGVFPLVTLCMRPDPKRGEEWIPDDDVALAQKLALEADEETFLRCAIWGR